MLFLHWFDDNPKHTTAQRLADAAQAYAVRFGVQPNVALVSEQDASVTLTGCEVRAGKRIGPNNYQVGRSE